MDEEWLEISNRLWLLTLLVSVEARKHLSAQLCQKYDIFVYSSSGFCCLSGWFGCRGCWWSYVHTALGLGWWSFNYGCARCSYIMALMCMEEGWVTFFCWIWLVCVFSTLVLSCRSLWLLQFQILNTDYYFSLLLSHKYRICNLLCKLCTTNNVYYIFFFRSVHHSVSQFSLLHHEGQSQNSIVLCAMPIKVRSFIC